MIVVTILVHAVIAGGGGGRKVMTLWETSLRKYTSTSFEDGGPGESSLVSEIRLALAEIKRLQLIMADLPKWVGELVQAQNQLHGIRYTKMAKDTIAYVEKQLQKAADAKG